MVSIVIVSHSAMLAQGVVELARQMAKGSLILAAGGTEEGEIGTSAPKIAAQLQQALAHTEGVVVLMDLGSAYLNTALAIEMLPEHLRDRVHLSDAPLVEGAILAAISAASGGDAAAVLQSAGEGRQLPKIT
jgi:PTS hybrid protein